MDVSTLIIEAFQKANLSHQTVAQTWVSVSYRVGGLLPNSLLGAAIQRDGNVDVVLRSMEDELAAPKATGPHMMHFHYQKMLSELWVGSVYETVRLLVERKLGPADSVFRELAHDLTMLRIPLEKHEIARDKKLTAPLQMRRLPPNNGETGIYEYPKDDSTKAHIMPVGTSGRGSVMWNVIDIQANVERWLERRDLSERLLAVWGFNHGSTP